MEDALKALLENGYSMLFAAVLLDQLGVPADRRGFGDLGRAAALVPGTPLPKPEGVFPRHVEPEAA